MRTYWLVGENKIRRRMGTPVSSASTRLKRRSFPRRRRTDLLKMSSLPTIKQPGSLDKHTNEVISITYYQSVSQLIKPFMVLLQKSTDSCLSDTDQLTASQLTDLHQLHLTDSQGAQSTPNRRGDIQGTLNLTRNTTSCYVTVKAIPCTVHRRSVHVQASKKCILYNKLVRADKTVMKLKICIVTHFVQITHGFRIRANNRLKCSIQFEQKD